MNSCPVTRRLLPIIGLAALMAIPSNLAAQEIARSTDGTISVRASDVPLGRLLRAVGQVVPFQKLVLDPNVEERPVTVTVEGIGIQQALMTILGSAAVDYVLASDDEGTSLKLVAGNRVFIASSQRTVDRQPATSGSV